MSDIKIGAILIDSLKALLTRLPTAALITVIQFLFQAGPVLLLALGVGYLVQYPDLFSTQFADGQTRLTWLGRFVTWHKDNDWFFPALSTLLMYISFSWESIAWLRKRAGLPWLCIPIIPWIIGALLMAALIHGRAYLSTLYPSNPTLTMASIAFTVAYLGFRFASVWVNACTRRALKVEDAYAQLKPHSRVILGLAAFFAVAQYGTGAIIDYIDARTLGTTLTERALGMVLLPFLHFWFLSAVFSLAVRTDKTDKVAPQ